MLHDLANDVVLVALSGGQKGWRHR